MESLTANGITMSMIKTIRGGGVPSDDERLEQRTVLRYFNNYRAVVIKQKFDRNRLIDPQLWQKINGMVITKTDEFEACNITSGCTLKRVKIPKVIHFPDNKGIRILKPDQKTYYKIVHPDELDILMWRATQISPYFAWISGDHAYLVTPEGDISKYISIRVILADPTEIKDFEPAGCADCFTWDSRYPVNREMVATIQNLVYEKEFRLVLSTQSDDINDASMVPGTGVSNQGQRG